jgi:N-acyl-D-amino-acid deacylase
MDILCETGLAVTMVDHYATEDIVRRIFVHPRALVGSDGIFGPRPHPRLLATAARVLGRYAMRERLITVEEAVGRLTARPADLLGLSDRGRIQEGLRADLVLLDPASYVDTATYDDPIQSPPGIAAVFVGGRAVNRDGQATGERPGEVARAPRDGR